MAAAAALLAPSDLPGLIPLPADGEPKAFGGVELRPYQRLAITAVLRAWKEGRLQQLVSMPTGTGKTVVFSSFIRFICEQHALSSGDSGSESSSGSGSGSSGDGASDSDGTSGGGGGAGGSGGGSGGGSSEGQPAGGARGAPRGAPRVLVLAHRGELLSQAEETLGLVWPGATVSVVQRESKDMSGQIVVASVFTALNCLPALAAQHFHACIVDECHHTTAATWLHVLEGTGFLRREPSADFQPAPVDASAEDSEDEPGSDAEGSSSGSGEALDPVTMGAKRARRRRYLPGDQGKLLLGFTATAYRRKAKDSRDLMKLYGEPVFAASINTMISNGYLAKVVNERVVTEEDMGRVGLGTDGDFNQKELSDLCNSPSRNALVVETWRRLAGPGGSKARPDGTARKTLVFAVDRAHAEALTKEFEAAGVKGCALLHGGTPLQLRRSVLTAFKHGALSVLVNVMILTEGFDDPMVEAVFMARPTRSTSLYTQMVGRGLRRHPLKREGCLVVDFTDSGGKHDISQIVDWRTVLDAGEDSAPPAPPGGDRAARVGEALQAVRDLLQADDGARFCWVQSGPHFSCSLFNHGSLWLKRLSPPGLPGGAEAAAQAAAHAEGEPAATAAAGGAGAAGAAEAAAGSPGAGSGPEVEGAEAGRQAEAGALLLDEGGGGGGAAGSQDEGGTEGEEEEEDEEEEEEEEGARDEERYLPLLQPPHVPDPAHWQRIGGAAVPNSGLSLVWAQGLAEDWVISHESLGAGHRSLLQAARWRHQPASDGQITMLRRLGLAIRKPEAKKGAKGAKGAKAGGKEGDRVSKGEAAMMIDTLMKRPATPEQRAELQAQGRAWEEPLLFTRAEALLSGAKQSARAAAAAATDGPGGAAAAAAAAAAARARRFDWVPGDVAATEKQTRLLLRLLPGMRGRMEAVLGAGHLTEDDLRGLSKQTASRLIGRLIGGGGGQGGGGRWPPGHGGTGAGEWSTLDDDTGGWQNL